MATTTLPSGRQIGNSNGNQDINLALFGPTEDGFFIDRADFQEYARVSVGDMDAEVIEALCKVLAWFKDQGFNPVTVLRTMKVGLSRQLNPDLYPSLEARGA